jgi:hypothetical protein
VLIPLFFRAAAEILVVRLAAEEEGLEFGFFLSPSFAFRDYWVIDRRGIGGVAEMGFGLAGEGDLILRLVHGNAHTSIITKLAKKI